MNISFKKDINKSYMVIEKVREYSETDFPVRMIEKNEIPGLLKMSFENLNGQYNFLYDISSKQAFSKLYETKKVSFEQIRNLLFSLKGVLRALEEYLLDADNIILKQECIFLDPEGKQIEYCYYPYYNGDLVLELRELFQKMLSLINYEDEKAVRLVYELQGELQRENFTIDNILEICQRIESPEAVKIRKVIPEEEPLARIGKYPERNVLLAPSGKMTGQKDEQSSPFLPGPVSSESMAIEPKALKAEETSVLEKVRAYFKGKNFFEILDDINSGEILEKIRQTRKVKEKPPALDPKNARTPPEAFLPPKKNPAPRPAIEYVSLEEHGKNLLAEESRYMAGNSEGTVLLNRTGRENHKLIGRKGQEGNRLVIRSFPFTIGKLESSSDAVLSESTISRIHARIYEQEGDVFLEDLNSTNGTFLNDSRLPAYQKTPLKEGDLLRFAEEEFCFR